MAWYGGKEESEGEGKGGGGGRVVLGLSLTPACSGHVKVPLIKIQQNKQSSSRLSNLRRRSKIKCVKSHFLLLSMMICHLDCWSVLLVYE